MHGHQIRTISDVNRMAGFDRFCVVDYSLLQDLDYRNPLQNQVLDRIYETIMSDRGSMKTFRGRFQEIDQKTRGIIDDLPDQSRPIRILDIAASNGICSYEMYDTLRPHHDIAVTASDLIVELQIAEARIFGVNWRMIFFDAFADGKLTWIQAINNRSIVSNKMLRKRFPGSAAFWLNKIHSVFVQNLIFPAFLRKIRTKTISTSRISLLHPELRIQHTGNFSYKRLDMYDLSTERCYFLRIMTITKGLKPSGVSALLDSIYGSLLDGGYLIIGHGKIECSFYVKQNGKFNFMFDVARRSSLHRDICNYVADT